MNYSRRFVLFDGSSGQSSTYTSSSIFVPDFTSLTLSYESVSTHASLVTVSASNSDGLETSTITYSAITTIVSRGVYVVETGMRWLRVERSSLDSTGIVQLQARAS